MPNLLIHEKSPYLLQHAHNPVEWMPWGEEAFARAKAEDKLLLVSIGYSTCHWCHVMEHESFEDPVVAALMNKALICVKVDREERPDVDRIYMNAVTALTGQGGWPLNCFVTPDGRPVYGGTYFPPQPRHQRPSWSMLVEGIAKAWRDPASRQKMEKDGNMLLNALKRLEEPAQLAESLTTEPLDLSLGFFRRAYDSEHGGFATAPKFPMPVNQHLLLRLSRRYAAQGQAAEAAECAEMVLKTLKEMAKGGIHDHLGGGFARYSTDEVWQLPHFEKMLYDNAQLATNYTEAYTLSGDPALAETLRGIIAYVLRDLRAPEGAFYSAEDADSAAPEGRVSKKGGHGGKHEGAFYVWSKAEVEAVLDPALAALFCANYGFGPEGNVGHDPMNEFDGLNVIWDRSDTVGAQTGGTADLTPEELQKKLAQARALLLAARSKRPRPSRDEKILSSWNGLMIAGLAKAGAALQEPAWIAAGVQAAGFFLQKMWEPATGLLWRRYAGGERAVEGQADDYACMAWACFELHQATLEPRWLEATQALMAAARTRFYDEADGQYWLAGKVGDPRLPVRVKDSHDNVEPSPASIFVELQLRLWALTGEERWREDAERTLKALSADLARAPRAYPFMIAALDLALRPAPKVVLVGSAEEAAALATPLRRGFHPGLVLARAEEGAEGFKRVDGKAAAYVCQGLSCQAPVTTSEALKALLA